MLFDLHQQIHDTYGMCLWTILAFIVFAIMIVITIIHIAKQKRRDDKFDNKMEDKYEMTEIVDK